jgi:hypothetical protein
LKFIFDFFSEINEAETAKLNKKKFANNNISSPDEFSKLKEKTLSEVHSDLSLYLSISLTLSLSLFLNLLHNLSLFPLFLSFFSLPPSLSLTHSGFRGIVRICGRCNHHLMRKLRFSKERGRKNFHHKCKQEREKLKMNEKKLTVRPKKERKKLML